MPAVHGVERRELLAGRLVVSGGPAADQRLVALRRDAHVDVTVRDGRRGPVEIVVDRGGGDRDNRPPHQRQVRGPQGVQVAVRRGHVHDVLAAGTVVADGGGGYEALAAARRLGDVAEEDLAEHLPGRLVDLIKLPGGGANEHGPARYSRAGKEVTAHMPLEHQAGRVSRRDRRVRAVERPVPRPVQVRRPIRRGDGGRGRNRDGDQPGSRDRRKCPTQPPAMACCQALHQRPIRR